MKLGSLPLKTYQCLPELQLNNFLWIFEPANSFVSDAILLIACLSKLQVVLVFAQHLASGVPGKFPHQTTMNHYKDPRGIQKDTK